VSVGTVPARPDTGPTDPERQITVHEEAPFSKSTPMWREKAKICKMVADTPEGTSYYGLVSRLEGVSVRKAGEWGSDAPAYKRVQRFITGNTDFFEVESLSGVSVVYPSLELFDLISRGIIQNPSQEVSTGGLEFCENLLSGVSEVNGKGERLLEYNLREYVDRINDLRLILHSDVADPEYISLPYKTRFNDMGRIKKQRAIMSNCLRVAGGDWNHAVMLTLTTDPKKFGSINEMVCGDPNDRNDSGINGNWNRLMSWLASDAQLGYRPEYVKILEFTEKGYPHIHAIVFLEEESLRGDGMPYLCGKNELSNYWNKYQGQIVDMQPLIYQDDLGERYDQDSGWVRWQKDGNHGGLIDGDDDDDMEDRPGQTAGQYLGKYLSAIYSGIRGMSSERLMTDGGEVETADSDSSGWGDLAGQVEKEDSEKDKAAEWKIAMYWATGRKIRTESRGLREKVEEEREEEEEGEEGEAKADIAEALKNCGYEFVGAYNRDRIPAHIRRQLVAVDQLMGEADSDTGPPDRGRRLTGSLGPSRDSVPDQMEGSGMLWDGNRSDEFRDQFGDDGDDLDDDQEGSGTDVSQFM